MYRADHRAGWRASDGPAQTLVNRPDHLAFQDAQNLRQFVPAPQDLTIHADDCIKALFCPQFRALFDAVQRGLGRSAKDGKDGNIAQAGNAVVAPFPHSHHPSIDPKNGGQFPTVEADPLMQARLGGKGCRRLDRHPVMLRSHGRKSSPIVDHRRMRHARQKQAVLLALPARADGVGHRKPEDSRNSPVLMPRQLRCSAGRRFLAIG